MTFDLLFQACGLHIRRKFVLNLCAGDHEAAEYSGVVFTVCILLSSDPAAAITSCQSDSLGMLLGALHRSRPPLANSHEGPQPHQVLRIVSHVSVKRHPGRRMNSARLVCPSFQQEPHADRMTCTRNCDDKSCDAMPTSLDISAGSPAFAAV